MRVRGPLTWPSNAVPGGLLLATFAVYAWLARGNPQVGFLADDALYLMMADIYSPYREATGAAYDHVRQYSHLPPIFSLLLAVAGAGVEQLSAARLVSAVCMAAAWALYLWWLHRAGVPRLTALLLAGFGAWTPATLIYTVDLWSEGLYVALVMVCLLLMQIVEPRVADADRMLSMSRGPVAGSSLPVLLALGVTLTLVVATRSIGVALLPALLLTLRARGLRAVAVVAVAAVATRLALSPFELGAAAPSYRGMFAQSYSAEPVAALWRQVSSVLADLPAAMVYDLFQWREPGVWQLVALALPGVACSLGFGRELLAVRPMALYALGYFAIVLVWPFPGQTDRFLYPLLPCVLWFAWRGTTLIDRRGRAGLLLALLLFGLAAPGIVRTAQRAVTPLPQRELDSFRTTRYWLDATRRGNPVAAIEQLAARQRVAASIAAVVPPTDCVYTLNVHLVLLHAQRPTFLPPPPPRMQAGPPWACRWFLLVADSMNGRPPLYPLTSLQTVADTVAVFRPEDAIGERHHAVTAVLMRVRGPR